jgi:hypothetical protein
MKLRELIDFYLRGRHRLETISLLPLGCTIAYAVALYGQPISSEPTEETSDITLHVFIAGPYHEVRVWEWNGAIQSVVYFSVKSDPSRDLKCVLTHYQGDSTWNVMEPGYWYQRADGTVRLWCSAAPVIGVGHVKFLEAEAAYKRAHNIEQLSQLPDITWAPNDAVSELQRQFVEGENAKLMEFANRSDRIAMSPDGRDVLIVRNHHAYDVNDGFMELNEPPQPGDGYATEVINCFHWDNDGSMWSKITLPRDAHVDRINFEGERCHLYIRRTSTGVVLKFNGPAVSIRGLSRISISSRPYDDAELWQNLQEAARDASAETNGIC